LGDDKDDSAASGEVGRLVGLETTCRDGVFRVPDGDTTAASVGGHKKIVWEEACRTGGRLYVVEGDGETRKFLSYPWWVLICSHPVRGQRVDGKKLDDSIVGVGSDLKTSV
jgi:hypothetical protein